MAFFFDRQWRGKTLSVEPGMTREASRLPQDFKGRQGRIKVAGNRIGGMFNA